MITLISTILAITIGVFFQKVADYISFLGGFCGVFIGYIFPGMVYLQCQKKVMSRIEIIGCITLVVVFTTGGLIGAGVTLFYLISPHK